jgi:hypothetical protein
LDRIKKTTMEYINNGDSASSIRTKLNLLIDFYNASTTTTTTTTMYMGGGGGENPPYNPPANDVFDVWNYGAAMPAPMLDAQSACSAVQMSNFHSVYLQKDPMNMAGTVVPEANDYVYTDSAKTMPLSSGYYGYRDMNMMMNKYIYIDNTGRITEINYCA